MKVFGADSMTTPNSTAIRFAALIVIVCLAACGKKTNQDGEILLRYFMWGTPTVQEMHRRVLDLFEKKHPGVKVRLEASSWGAYWDKLQVQLATNTAPDVYWMSGAYFFNFVDAGVFLNLTPFIHRDAVCLDDYFLEQELFGDRRHVYGLPKDMTSVVLYYNKNMFDELGMPYPDDSWDWVDFLHAATKLTRDKDGDGEIDQWGTGAFMPWLEEYLAPVLFSNGGSVLNEAKTKCLLDQPPAIEAVQFMVDLLRKHKVCVLPGQTGSVGGDAFMTGQVAMMQNTSALIPEYSKVKTFRWAIAPIPKSPRTGKRVSSRTGLVHVVNSRAKNPGVAWELVKFFSSEEAQRILAENKVFAPALKRAAYDVFAIPPPENVGEVLRAYDYGRELELTKNWLEVNDAVQRELEPAFLGTTSVAQACQAATRAVNRILRN